MIPAHQHLERSIQKNVIPTDNVHFNRILVGIDFSNPAARALQVAIAVGEIFASKITLVHAATKVYGPQTYPMRAEFLRKTLDRTKERMNQLVTHEPRLRQLGVTSKVVYGSPVDLIQQTAVDENADLIVVGSHGASGIEQLVLGSVAESVLRKVLSPVLVVGPKCVAEENPFRSILLATDLQTTGSRPVQYARALASSDVSSHLTLLHVAEKSPHIPGLDPELFENSLREELRRLIPSHSGLKCRPKIVVEYGKPAQAILDVAKSQQASLVIVGLRHQAALSDHVPWSTLSHVIRDVEGCVLVVNNSLH